MAIGIYRFICTINNKIYIGRSVNLTSRRAEHLRDLRNNNHCNKKLQDDYNLFGEHSFEYGIIEICEKSELSIKEKFYINEYNSVKTGYNLNGGGQGSEKAESTRKKLSESKNDIKVKVFGYDISGNLLKEWNSITECSKYLNSNKCDVRRTLKEIQITCKGYILRYGEFTSPRKNKIYERQRNDLGRYI